MRIRSLVGMIVLVAVWAPASAQAAQVFATAQSFGAGDSPSSVAVGDFNGDSKPDLAVANAPIYTSDTSGVSVLLGNGGGKFGPPQRFSAGGRPTSVAVGDFNGDSDLDLVVANATSDNVSLLLGDGAGGFGAAHNFGTGVGPRSVAVGDFNGDSDPDLAVGNSNSNNVSVLLGDGAGGFGAAQNYGAGTAPFSVAAGDFNGDSHPDLAIANYFSNNVSVLLGDGSGSFAAAHNFGAGACALLGGGGRLQRRLQARPGDRELPFRRCLDSARATAPAALARRTTLPPGLDLPQSRWATSTATQMPTSRWREPTTTAPTPS